MADVCPECGVGWCPGGIYCVDCDAKRTKAALRQMAAVLRDLEWVGEDEEQEECLICGGKKQGQGHYDKCPVAESFDMADAALAQQ